MPRRAEHDTRRLASLGLSPDAVRKILNGIAARLLGLERRASGALR